MLRWRILAERAGVRIGFEKKHKLSSGGFAMLTRRAFVVATCSVSLAGKSAAHAETSYPNHMIRIFVGYPPGGGVDSVARLVADPMKDALGQPIVVENRAGAAAMLAAQAVASAADDGHTLLMAAAGEVAVNQHLYKAKMQYDPLKDLVPIALAGIVPCVVVVNAKSPIKSPADLVAYAKANMGKLTFSSSGVGNPQHLAGELMNRMAGTDVLHVPYRGSVPAVTDVAVGSVTMSFSSLGAALPLIQAGQIRAVAVTSKERMPQLPQVAPLRDGPGLEGYELLNWFAMFAPSSIPEPILARLSELVTNILKDPTLAAKLEVQGIVPRPMTSAQLRTFVQSESEKFGKIIEAANIKTDN
jgi:tripartite-type tricarboxylate transporter receptor subunit TctC